MVRLICQDVWRTKQFCWTPLVQKPEACSIYNSSLCSSPTFLLSTIRKEKKDKQKKREKKGGRFRQHFTGSFCARRFKLILLAQSLKVERIFQVCGLVKLGVFLLVKLNGACKHKTVAFALCAIRLVKLNQGRYFLPLPFLWTNRFRLSRI